VSRSFRLAELADYLGAEVVGDADKQVRRVRPLADAGVDDISFLHNSKYAQQARSSAAGAVLVARADDLPGRDLLVTAEPYQALARLLELMHPAYRPPPGVHPSAVVSEGAAVGDGVSIGACAVLEQGCSIGPGSVIGAGCVIGRDAEVGRDSHLHPQVVIEDRCRVGDRCIIHSGTVLGSDGFGFATVDGVHHKVPQVGIVVLEDDVELGSNVCVDRATLGETRIGRGVKVDNQVQVGHNVRIGEGSILVAQVAIAGSATLGRYVVMGGHSGVAGHLEIGDGVQITAQTGVYKDIGPGQTVSGVPARPRNEWVRSQAAVARLTGLRDRVRDVENRVAELESAAARTRRTEET